MARTKASVGAKVSFGKSSKAQKVTVQPSVSGKSKVSSKSSSSGGNPYCPRETPNWQLPITRFFPDLNPSNFDKSSGSCHHESQDKANMNTSDIDSDVEIDSRLPLNEINTSLYNGENVDESNVPNSSDTELLPLIDDPSSHKIAEYFDTNKKEKNDIKVKDSIKNKGIGKSSKNKNNSVMAEKITVEKENVHPVEQRKRNISDYDDGDDIDSVKRLKISC